MWIRLIILLAIATPVNAEQLKPSYGQSVTGVLSEMMIERAQEANDGSADHDRYIRVCKGRICTYEPMQGRVVYQTPYGQQVVNYGE